MKTKPLRLFRSPWEKLNLNAPSRLIDEPVEYRSYSEDMIQHYDKIEITKMMFRAKTESVRMAKHWLTQANPVMVSLDYRECKPFEQFKMTLYVDHNIARLDNVCIQIYKENMFSLTSIYAFFMDNQMYTSIYLPPFQDWFLFNLNRIEINNAIALALDSFTNYPYRDKIIRKSSKLPNRCIHRHITHLLTEVWVDALQLKDHEHPLETKFDENGQFVYKVLRRLDPLPEEPMSPGKPT